MPAVMHVLVGGNADGRVLTFEGDGIRVPGRLRPAAVYNQVSDLNYSLSIEDYRSVPIAIEGVPIHLAVKSDMTVAEAITRLLACYIQRSE